MSPREAEGYPWDTVPAEEKRERLAGRVCLVISLAFGVAAAAWPVLLGADAEGPQPDEASRFLLRWIALLVVALFALRLHAVFRSRSAFDRIEEACRLRRTAICFESVTLFRSLRGPGTVTFREDECRVRDRTAAQNLAMLRKIALNLIKQHSTAKISLKARRKKVAWDDQYMTQIISGKFHA